ncbi:heme biosynthesis protein HemY [Marinicauda salina]|uniref:Heme biosynthesis protein HemY n=1 Tax=Marinicauda salina TaxID=2135793 RepID=A0A2U2BW41_9PROT|nr:heme biosynthesis HemY N-terminal domain-containing protein [Marinicauda salina]PWE18199.1 heme biosynthesis protein HemY [Marinicauda salina]
MIRLIITIALCVLTAAAAVFLTLNPGVVTIEFLGWRAEAPFALGAAALIVATFVLVVAWWLFTKVWTAPDMFRRFRARRRREQGFDALERALIASAAGEGELAVRQAARADALLDRPAISRLLAARAAEAASDLPTAETHYEALLEDPRTKLVAQRGLAGLAEARGDAPAAITHASAAFEKSRTARWAFETLFNAQVADARWEPARRTLAEAERRKQVGADIAARRRAVLMTAEARACAESDPDRAADLAERAAVASPGFAPAAALAGRLLAKKRRHRRASDLLESAWQAAPHPAIARVYGELRKSDTKAKRAERLRDLARLNPEHRESRILTAEVALEQSNIEAARSALAPILAHPPLSARVCALAARLARLEGDEDEARRYMARASHAPGEADWSDIDAAGAAFPYSDEDWKRMVYAWGDEARLIHPRYERFEIAAEAVPETALLEAPKRPAKKTEAGETHGPPRYYEPSRAPDDPGVEDEGDDGEKGR